MRLHFAALLATLPSVVLALTGQISGNSAALDTSHSGRRPQGPIARLVAVSGDGQSAPAGTLLPAPLVVRAEDEVGNGVPGVVVEFTVVAGAGILSTATDSTDASATASTRLELGTTPGTNRVEALVAALSGSPVTFTSTGEPPQLLRGPYLQQVTSNSTLVIWKMTAAVPCSLDYGIGSFAQTIVTPPDTQQVITLDGLDPGNQYDYQIRCGSLQVGGGDCFIRTAPLPDSSLTYRLLAWGDSGKGDAAQMAVAAVLNTQTADLALHVGDIIYNSGEASRYNSRYFTPYAPLLRHVPVWAVLGNHDAITLSAFLDAWYLPTNPIDGTERYYSFDYGDLHIVALDTNLSLDSTILGWLDADLGASDRQWKIVFFHHTMYSCGSAHGSSTTLISKLGPIFDRQAVDLVVYGHDHHYERSFPMYANQPVGAWMEPDYRSPGGTIYIVTGGGAGPRSVNEGCAHTAVALPISHFTRFDFVGNRLTVEAVDTSAQVVDRMTLDKGLPPPPRPQYDLTVSVSPPGAGAVQLEPPGGTYDEDTVVQVAAGAASGWMFSGWSGDLIGTVDPELITMRSDQAVVANFVERIADAQVALQEVKAGGSAGSTTVGTAEPLLGIGSDLYVAAVSTRLYVAVDSVAGLGLTWAEIRSQCAARNRTGISLWRAQGTPNGDGAVTATLAAAPDNAAIVVTRYSGVDASTPILTILAGNSNGLDGACVNGSDTDGYSFELANAVGDGLVYFAVGMRDRTHTPDPGTTENLEVHYGSSSFGAGIAVCDRLIGSSPISIIEGTFSETADWAVVALLLLPASSTLPSSVRDTDPSAASQVLRAWPLPYRGGILQVACRSRIRADEPFVIHDASGRLVRRLAPVAGPIGDRRATWDGRDESGRPVAAGIYFLTENDAGLQPVKVVVLR